VLVDGIQMKPKLHNLYGQSYL